MHTKSADRNRTGQAMIELTVALVAVLAITAGLLQVASLGRAHTEAMVNARRKAGTLALTSLTTFDEAHYILNWTPGPDGKHLTRDDTFQTNTATGPFNSVIVEQAADGDNQWDELNKASRTDLPALRRANPATLFGLVRGYDRSEPVPLISAVQHLLYRANDIEVDAEVWMTHTGHIY